MRLQVADGPGSPGQMLQSIQRTRIAARVSPAKRCLALINSRIFKIDLSNEIAHRERIIFVRLRIFLKSNP